MNTQDFVDSYLKPSEDRLDRRFTMPLPGAGDLVETGRFIVQGRQDDTFSTNIMTVFAAEAAGVRLVEVYKNTQDTVQGTFVRLVGTICAVKKGYPFFFLDAAVSNVNPLTAEKEDVTTRVAVHLPQGDVGARSGFFDSLSEQARASGYACQTRQVDALPPFWGPLWIAQAEGFAQDCIKTLRDAAWAAYERCCAAGAPQADFDYSPTKNHIVFNHSRIEHQMFKNMGLSVPVESQAAFFSVLVAGVS